MVTSTEQDLKLLNLVADINYDDHNETVGKSLDRLCVIPATYNYLYINMTEEQIKQRLLCNDEVDDNYTSALAKHIFKECEKLLGGR